MIRKHPQLSANMSMTLIYRSNGYQDLQYLCLHCSKHLRRHMSKKKIFTDFQGVPVSCRIISEQANLFWEYSGRQNVPNGSFLLVPIVFQSFEKEDRTTQLLPVQCFLNSSDLICKTKYVRKYHWLELCMNSCVHYTPFFSRAPSCWIYG